MGLCGLEVYTNDQQTSKAFVEGDFPVRWNHSHFGLDCSLSVLSSTTRVFPGDSGSSSRRKLTSLRENGRYWMSSTQCTERIHHSGLLFGYAADRSTEPDWYVLPDGRQPKAWKLLHAARKGGDRFCVGSGPRYAAGQAGDAANKAKDYQFESLHKIYFYDAWRWKIELNQPGSPLRLPPRPGLLQNGCYWQPTPERVDSATAHKTHKKVLPVQKLASPRPVQQRARRLHLQVKYRNLLAKVRQRNPRPPLS